jgi:hypothetical protein
LSREESPAGVSLLGIRIAKVRRRDLIGSSFSVLPSRKAAVVIDDQHEVIGFLSTTDTCGFPAGSVERIDTHINVVWVAGARAYR